MADEQPRYTLDRVVRMVLSAAVLIGVFVLLRYLSDVLLPFVAAVVLAYLLNPLVTVFERKTKRRGLSVAITIGGLFVVGLAIVAILIPLMIGQVGRFRDDILKLRDDFAASMQVSIQPSASAPDESAAAEPEGPGGEKTRLGWRELKESWASYRSDVDKPRPARLAELAQKVEGTYIGDLIGRIQRYAQSDEFNQLLLDTAKRLAIGGWSVVTFGVNLILGLTGLIVVLLYLVFLLLDYPEYARMWPTFLPPRYRASIVEFLEQFNQVLRRYLRGQSIVALLVGTLCALGFTLIGLPMAVPLGLFVGLLNMVPYLQAVALVPGMMLAGLRAVEGDSGLVASLLLTLSVFAVVQILQDTVIAPRVMGRATGLRPVAIMLGVFIWGKLLGFTGLLLAIPLTCLGIAYYRRFMLEHGAEATAVAGEPSTPERALQTERNP